MEGYIEKIIELTHKIATLYAPNHANISYDDRIKKEKYMKHIKSYIWKIKNSFCQCGNRGCFSPANELCLKLFKNTINDIPDLLFCFLILPFYDLLFNRILMFFDNNTTSYGMINENNELLVPLYIKLQSFKIYDKFHGTTLFLQLNRDVHKIINKHLEINKYFDVESVNVLESRLLDMPNDIILNYTPRFLNILYGLVNYDMFDHVDINEQNILSSFYEIVDNGNRDIIDQLNKIIIEFNAPLIMRIKYYIDKHIKMIKAHNEYKLGSDNYKIVKNKFENMQKN